MTIMPYCHTYKMIAVSNIKSYKRQILPLCSTALLRLGPDVGWIQWINGGSFFRPKKRLQIAKLEHASNDELQIVDCKALTWSNYKKWPNANHQELRVNCIKLTYYWRVIDNNSLTKMKSVTKKKIPESTWMCTPTARNWWHSPW